MTSCCDKKKADQDATTPPSDLPPLRHDPQWEIHPFELRDALAARHEIVLLDVRSPAEWEKAHLASAILTPLEEMPRRLDELTVFKDKRVVVYCHHGRRSLQGVRMLRSAGFRMVHSLVGGIEAWSLYVDQHIPRYER